jgi:hypothetical protein
MRPAVASLILLIASSSAGYPQTLQEIDKRDAAVMEAWAATPLALRRAVFVSEHPAGFGQYVERPNNVFKQGEKLVTYAEPVGYGWKDLGNGAYEFGFKVDFLVKSPDGKILAGQEDFADLTEKSHARNREFMVVLTMNLTGAPAGDYVIEYKLRDIASSKTVNFSQPFKIVD